MQKRSGMLKVISILMIIFSAIALVIVLAGLAAVMALGDVAAYVEQYMNISVGMYYASMVLAVISPVLELIAGIMGLACKSKSVLKVVGILVIIVCLISLIITIMTTGFSFTSLISFVLPILYVVGVGQCIE